MVADRRLARSPISVAAKLPSRLGWDGQFWRNDDLNNEIVSAQSEGWLKHLGFVPEAQLPLIYAGARLFIYPSIYEGFGLPPIEAMASGVPVIISNRSCLPEVCGDAARFIDPDDVEGFTAAIEASLLDEQWRSRIIGKGLERGRLFTWDRCVQETVAVYKKAWGQLAFPGNRSAD